MLSGGSTATRTGRPPKTIFGFVSLGYLRAHRRRIVIVAILACIEVLAALSAPLIVRLVVESIETAQVGLLVGLAVLVIAAYSVRALSAWALFYQSHVVAYRMVHTLRRTAYAQVQRMPPAWFAARSSGEVTARVMKDSDDVEPLLADVAFGFVAAVAVAIGTCAVLVWLDPWLALAALLPIPIATWALLGVGRMLQASFASEHQDFAALSGRVQDQVSGMREIQSFAREGRMLARLSRHSLALARGQIVNRCRIGALGPIVEAATGISLALVVLAGALRIQNGSLTIADLVAAMLLVAGLYQPLNMLLGAAEAAQKGLTALRRLDALFAEVPTIAEKPNAVDPRPARGHLVFENVSFAYEEGRTVLHDVNFELWPGQTVAAVGSTGAGKSTLAALAARFHDPTSGRITLDGRDLRDITISGLRGSVAQVSQDVFLFNAPISEVIGLGHPLADLAAIESAARAAEAHEFISALPQGYDTVVGERGVRLSGGQKQRLSLARALLKDAPILILDEATSAVDTATEARLQATLSNALKGRAALIIAHRLSTIRHADHILVLHQGQIVESGTHEALLALGGRYRNLVGKANEPSSEEDTSSSEASAL